MFAAEVQFTIPGSVDDAEDLIFNLLSSWRSNGQVLGSEWCFSQKGNIYRTTVMIYDAHALALKHDNQYARKSRRALTKINKSALKINVIGEDPFSAEICTCKKHSFYILFTNFLSLESPLRCGDCFGPLPLYKITPKLPRQPALHDGIKFWRADYQSCDTLQMGCTVGEKFGERELFRHDSSLSTQGISICNTIAKETGIATFYYLLRSKGRNLTSEKKRKCPSCGGDWLLDKPLHHLFDFKCNRCRLLSNIAFSVR
jgi:predicted  nucleic acid-binding Zn ribbon protein